MISGDLLLPINYPLPEYLNPIPENINMLETNYFFNHENNNNNNIPYHLNRYFADRNTMNFPTPHLTDTTTFLDLTPSPTYSLINNNNYYNSSTSDEAEEQQTQTVIDERKQRRMISNRESARRSRMRKQKHLDELCSQVMRFRNQNHDLVDKINHVSECHDRVLEDNTRLKEEASELRQMLSDARIGSPFTSGFGQVD